VTTFRFGSSEDTIHEALFAPEHELLRKEVQGFVEREIHPHATAWERAGAFPKALFRSAGELGLWGLKYGDDVGGSGPDLIADAVVTEELARCRSAGVAAAFGAHKDLATLYVSSLGTREQLTSWLVPAIRGEIVGALAITEPDAGSDVAAIATTARRRGDGWILNGTKTFITNGAWADFVVVAATTDSGAGKGAITLFVVDAGTDGVSARRIPMLGWRPSQTGELAFSDVIVPDSHRLGEVGGGFAALMRNFEWERVTMALAAVAGAQSTYEMAKSYALDRTAFGRPVGNFQVWRHRFAEMATRIEAGRALTYHALRLIVEGAPAMKEVAMAKLYTSEVAVHVADECVQVHGGYGYMTEFDAERALRDARLGPIGGGTSEIMKEIVGKSLGL
jgi:acyl-CoA dehydrogenase